MHKKLETVTEMKNKLITKLNAEMDKGFECLDAKEAGEVTDMIKDLAEAEEKCMKALYYKSIVEAMHEYGESDDMDNMRRGYDNWRYSSGRFAPTGHGHRSGYRHLPMDDFGMDPAFINRLGYRSQSGNTMHYGSNRSMGSSSGGRSGMTDNYDYGMGTHERGDKYHHYDEARRHYHETHSSSDKEMMNMKAKEYVGEMAMTMKEMWDEADPDLRRHMKQDFAKLLGEMQ